MAANKDGIFIQINTILTQALKYTSVPRRSVAELLDYFQSNPRLFSEAIDSILIQLLPRFRKDDYSEKALRVIILVFDELKKQVCSFESQVHSQKTLNLVLAVIERLSLGMTARDKSVREGSSWMIQKILSINIHQLLDFPEELYSKLTKQVKVLLKDKSNYIRGCAISIANQLDLNYDILCISINDKNKENRKTAIVISDCTDNIEVISQGIFDIMPEVRIATLTKIREVDIRNLSLDIRREIIFLITRDRSVKVRIKASEVITKNIQSIGLLEVFKSMELESLEFKHQKQFTICVRSIFNEMDPDLLKDFIKDPILPKLLESTCEKYELLISRIAIESLKSREDHALDSILPSQSLINLVPHIHPVFPYFFTQNIIKICICLDIGDEDTRKSLLNLLIDLCYNLELVAQPLSMDREFFLLVTHDYFAENSIEILEVIVDNIKTLLDQNPNEFSNVMSEIINNVREPLFQLQEDTHIVVFIEDTQRNPSIFDKREALIKKIIRIEEEIDAYENEQEILIQKDQLNEALRVKKEITSKIREVEELEHRVKLVEEELKEKLLRGLILTKEMLKGIQHDNMHLDILDLVTSLVRPSLDIEDETLQILALECLGQCCLQKVEICCRYIYLFKKVLDRKSDGLLEFTALKCLIDIYMLWDLRSLTEDNEEKMEISNDSLFWIMLKHLYSKNIYIKTLIAEGIPKLMLCGKAASPIVLSQLMILYFDYNSPAAIQQILQVFFARYSVGKKIHTEIMCEAFKLVIEFFVYTSLNPNSMGGCTYLFKIKRMFDFICMCVSSEYLQAHGNFDPLLNYRLDLFYYLSKKILAGPATCQGDLYGKMLGFVNLQSFSDKELALCKAMVGKVMREYKNKCVVTVQEYLDKKQLGYFCFEDIEDVLIDRWHQSLNLTKKFFEKVLGVNINFITPSKNQDSTLKAMHTSKRGSMYQMGSDLKRFK